MTPFRPRAARLAAPAPAALAALAALAACNNEVAAPGPPPAFVKVVHAIANAGPVNVVADTAGTLAANVPFGTVGPSPNFQYFSLPSGSRQVQVLPAAGGAAAISATLPVASNTFSTLIAAGTVGGAGALAPAFIVLTDSVSTAASEAPAAGRIRLRVVHAASTLGPVDVHAQFVGPAAGTTPAAPRNFSASTVLFGGVPFRGAASAQVPAPITAVTTGANPVPARNYDVCVLPAGVTPTANGSNCAILTALPAASAANGLTDAASGGLRRGRSVVTAIAVDPSPPGVTPATPLRLVFTTDKPVQP